MRTCTFLNRRRQECCTECGKALVSCLCLVPDDLAFKRHNSMIGVALKDVAAYLESTPGRLDHGLDQIVEALGAVYQKTIIQDREGPATNGEIYRALIQLTALSVRLAVYGDSEHRYEPDELVPE